MATSRTSSLRRREISRNLRRDEPGLWQSLRRRMLHWTLLFALLTATASWAVSTLTENRPLYAVGQLAKSAIVPRVEFRAIDEFNTRREREDARDREPAVYKVNTTYVTQIEQGMESLRQIGSEYDNVEQIPIDTRQQLGIDEAALRTLKQFNASETSQKDWQERVRQYIDGVVSIALLLEERKNTEIDPAERAPGIRIIHPAYGELPRPDSFIYGTGDLSPFSQKVTSFAETTLPPAIRRSAIAVVMQTQAQNPLPMYRLDVAETTSRRLAAGERAQPVEIVYGPSDVLVHAGREISELDLQLLTAESLAHREAMITTRVHPRIPLSGHLANILGRFGAMLLIITAMWAYIMVYNVRVARNPIRQLTIASLFVIAQLVAVVGTINLPGYLFATAVFPTVLVTMVLAIAYDQRFALALGAIHALLMVVTLNLPIAFAIVLLVGVGMVAARLDDVRTRSKLVIVGFHAGLAMAATTIIVGVGEPWMGLLIRFDLVFRDAVVTFLAGTGSGILVQGILPGIERVFRVTTAMTLRDLNDASHPLLRRLAQDAPGTYQHSLRMADMGEAAAGAIGANSLLCKVGAMYHDIGKMNKPLYFIENQGGGPNRHGKLSPAMSLLIIVGHVKDGIQMARDYHLPAAIRQFIETHHGTTLVEYFYHAAKQQKEAEKATAPSEFEFRYPGPKPQTREAAILMLCDGVESAARSLPEPTPVRIEQLVHQMAIKRLMDGQFDECNLTLQELHRIEQAITKSLTAIYHGRIAYPKPLAAPSTRPRPHPEVAPAKSVGIAPLLPIPTPPGNPNTPADIQQDQIAAGSKLPR